LKWRVSALAVLALVCVGCTAPEQPLLERFFATSRLRDKTALQAFSTVIFEPREQGIVRTFAVVGVSPERTVGGVTTKDVTLRAAVQRPGGSTVDAILIATLQRADERQAGYPWIVVAVTDVSEVTGGSGSRSAPRL